MAFSGSYITTIFHVFRLFMPAARFPSVFEVVQLKTASVHRHAQFRLEVSLFHFPIGVVIGIPHNPPHLGGVEV